jgi:hypothetical protein
MSKLPPAGNNVQTLQARSAATTNESSGVVETADLVRFEQDRLAEAKARSAAGEAAAKPTPSAVQPATGPAPVEFKEPVNGGRSVAGPAPAIVNTPIQSVASVLSLEERLTDLEDRIAVFNTRSSQKI